MAFLPGIFGQGSFQTSANMTPAEVERKRAYIAAMMPRFGSAKYVGEGIGQLATGVVMGRQNKKLDAAEKAGRESAAAAFERIFGTANSANAYGGASFGSTPSGTWTPEAPGPTPVEQATQGMPVAQSGGLSFGLPAAESGMIGGGQEKLDFGAAVMTPQEMLIEGATRRGLNPIDVATAISYETGGKFDPMIAGPTTQWGTHRGLIQFGEPQAQEHGVDFSNPDAAWRSQLNPDSGAIWSYLDGAGVKPGMGLPEIYSGINAGSVGRMNASDANNGGAPGTVADKVAGMGPHRDKAAQFLGGTWTPTEGGGQTYSTSGGGNYGGPQGGGIPMAELQMAMMNPWLMSDPAMAGVIQAEYQRQVQQSDPMYQLQLQQAQLELEKAQQPNLNDYDMRAAEAVQYGLQPGTPEYQAFVLTGNLPKAPEPGYTQLTPQEVQQLGLPPGVYQRGPDGRIDTVEKTQGGTDPIADLKARAAAAGLKEGTPEYQQFMLTNGKNDGMVIESDGQGGFRVVQGAGASGAAAKPFTEAQSKDVVFATRAKGALEAFDPIASALTDRGDSAAGWLPWGLGGGMQSDTYQVAKTAGDEFLQAILRKDTGAAITADEQALYGETYLPRPGDSDARLEYKREARQRAVAALEAGMSPAQIIAQERALEKGQQPAVDADGWQTLPNGVKVRVKQ